MMIRLLPAQTAPGDVVERCFCPLNATFGFVALGSSMLICTFVSACLVEVNLFWTTPSISYSSRAKWPLKHTAVAIS